MRVWLVVDYEALPGIDGECRYLRYGTLAAVLASSGHDVTWWTSDFDHVRKSHRNALPTTLIRPNLTLRMLPGRGYGRNISVQRIRHNRSVARSFASATRSIPADSRPDVVVVCLHALELSEAVAAFAISQNVPLVVDVVDIWPEVYLLAFPEALKGIARLCLHSEFLRARRTLASAQSITAVSKTYLDWASAQCPKGHKPRFVFPLGYDHVSTDALAVATEAHRLETNYDLIPSRTNLAFVGQLSHSYDLDTVVAAVRILHPSYKDRLRIFVAGEGVNRVRLEASAQDLPEIAWTGWLSHPAVSALLRSCSAGLVSYSGTATQSLPYKPFEYMAAGLALLSCLPGELADLIRREGVGLQYAAGSPESLAAAIRELVDNPDRCSAMRKRSEDLFNAQFRADTIYTRFAKHLESVASAQIDRSPVPV